MPSTKKRNSSQKNRIEEKFILDFKRKTSLERKNLLIDLNEELNKFINKIDVAFSKFPPEIQNMTLKDLCDIMNEEESEEEIEQYQSFQVVFHDRKNITSSDNGYITDKNVSTKSDVSVKNKIKLDRIYFSKKKAQQLALPVNIYSHTPKDKMPAKVLSITPKVSPNTPVSILRQPRCGEKIVSMTGSPILVSSILQEERMANLMLPLDNGDVISVLPTGNLRESLLPVLDANTVEQLKTLKSHIEKFIPNEK